MSTRFIEPVDSPYLVPFDGPFRILDAPTRPPPGERDDDKKHKKARKALLAKMRELQRRLYADDQWSLLLVFQGMDASGKDSTVRHVMRGVNPAGCQVTSFKQPSEEELDHDFLWRVSRRLPERGRIGIFNRSHYEEVLIVRVHPERIEAERLPRELDLETLWQERYESIRSFEKHLARNGTMIVKLFLNVSRAEQKRRFLDRIDEPEKNWKFNPADVAERRSWDRYMTAYQEALEATSRPWAPWFAFPDDDKPFLRRTVAEIVVASLERMNPRYPEVGHDRLREMKRLREALEREPDP